MDNISKAIMVAVGAVVVFLFYAASVQTGRMIDLNQQCLADGNKEYECYAMLHGGRGK